MLLQLLLLLLFVLWLFGEGRRLGLKFSWRFGEVSIDGSLRFLILSTEKQRVEEIEEEEVGRERGMVEAETLMRLDEMRDFVTFFGLVRNVLVGTLGLFF